MNRSERRRAAVTAPVVFGQNLVPSNPRFHQNLRIKVDPKIGGLVSEDAGDITVSSSVGAEVVSQFTVSSLFQFHAASLKEFAKLGTKVDDIVERLANIEAKVEALTEPEVQEIRSDVTDDVAKAEIRQFFSDHDGSSIYPSDVARALSLDYWLVSRLIDVLEEEGKISKV